MSGPIGIRRRDLIEGALADLGGRAGEELLRRAQSLVYGCDASAIACAGGNCWMEMHDVIGKGETLEAAIRAWCAAARAVMAEAA